MTQQRWTLRGADSAITILAITGTLARIDAVAIEVASHELTIADQIRSRLAR